jgi:hypothetical protein
MIRTSSLVELGALDMLDHPLVEMRERGVAELREAAACR